MKTKNNSKNFENQVVKYLTASAAHAGYRWDGIMINPGTTVASFKTIAAETGLSYYRVKKCLAALAESGAITISRHKCFAIIIVNTPAAKTKTAAVTVPDTTEDVAPESGSTPESDTAPESGSTPAHLPVLNRTARRRLAREAAKMAARTYKNIAKGTPERPFYR